MMMTMMMSDILDELDNCCSFCEMSRYIEKLKCLNESLLRWIDQHVHSNPVCILTPVFRDYDRHLDNLNKMFNVAPNQLSASSQHSVLPVAATNNTSMVVRDDASKSTFVNTHYDDDDDEGRINFSMALSPKTTRTRNNKLKQ